MASDLQTDLNTSASCFSKLSDALQQVQRPSAKAIEDLKVDRFLDQLTLQLQEPEFIRSILQKDAGVIDFFASFCKQNKGQAWVMTFALKLCSTLLSCPHWHQIWLANTTCTTPDYAAVTGDHNQVKGQILGQCVIELLVTARTGGYWDEASVRNAWLVVVNETIKACGEEQNDVGQGLLDRTDAVDVAFACLTDKSIFVVVSAQDLISSFIHKLCCLVEKEQSVKLAIEEGNDSEENGTAPAKIIKLDSSTTTASSSEVQGPKKQLNSLLRVMSNIQSSACSSASKPAESVLSMHQSRNQPSQAQTLKLATVGVVKRLWQLCNHASLRLLNEKLSWMDWCIGCLREDGELGRDVRIAVVEALPVLLSKYPWRSQDSKELKLLSDFFQLPIQVMRWQGIQYSLQITRALYNAQLLMEDSGLKDVVKQIECKPSLLQMLLVPLTSILQSSSDAPRPRRKLLGLGVNLHADAATCLAEVQDEVIMQMVQGQVSCVKLVCQCIDALMEVVEKVSLKVILQDLNLLKHLPSLLSLCWSDKQQSHSDETDVTKMQQKLKRSPKVTKAGLTLLMGVLGKIRKDKELDTGCNVDSVHDILKEITTSLTNVLVSSIGDQALMCKTLDTLTMLYISNASLGSSQCSLLSADLMDCIQNLAEEDSCSWEIRDSALGFLVAVIQHGTDSELVEAKTRRFHGILWDCVGDHEGFVQASAVSALPLVYEKRELWQAMLQQSQVTEVAVVSDIVHFLRVSGNPFVRTAAIATLTRWLTSHSDIQSSVLQACQNTSDDVPCTSSMRTGLPSDEQKRKPAPKDVPGVVSGYFQDILEAEATLTSQSASDNQGSVAKVAKPCRQTSGIESVRTLPSQLIGKQILTTMYQATNSSDVETSFKTLDFWARLFHIHAPQYVTSLDSTHRDSDESCNTIAKELYALFESGTLTHEKLIASLSKPSQEAVDTLRMCLNNTGCLRLLLGMLTDSKMVAERVCFMLHVLQGVLLVSQMGTDKEGIKEVITKPSCAKDIANTGGCEKLLQDKGKSDLEKMGTDKEGNKEDITKSSCAKDIASTGGCENPPQDKGKSDLEQSLGGITSLDLPFEEMLKQFLHLDFVSIGETIRKREIDSLDSVLDDMIEPSEEWGLPGDINVDCY